MLKRILWALAPVIASKIMAKRRGTQGTRAEKTRYNKNRGR